MALSIETLSLSGVWKSLKYPWVAATPAIRIATSGPRGCKRKEQNFILHNYFVQLQTKTVLIVCSKPDEAVFNLSWLGAIHL